MPLTPRRISRGELPSAPTLVCFSLPWLPLGFPALNEARGATAVPESNLDAVSGHGNVAACVPLREMR